MHDTYRRTQSSSCKTIAPCVFKECRVLLRIISEAGDSAVGLGNFESKVFGQLAQSIKISDDIFITAVINGVRITVIPLIAVGIKIYSIRTDLCCDSQCFLITVFFAVRPVKGLLSFYSYVSPVFYKFVLYFTRNGRHCQTP